MHDRVLYPATGFTIADAVAYYRAIAKVLLPHLKNRPVSFKRYIDTIDGESYWEKDAPGFTPDWVKRFPVPRREGGPPIEYIVINDTRTLLWIARVGGIEIHPFLHTIPNIDIATHVVFDLDPGEGAGTSECAKVALLLRDALKLECFAKVSGSKGIQVYVPPPNGAPHETTQAFARGIADELARQHPKLIVSEMAKTLRRGKVLIDWSQNASYKTNVAVYSLRATSEQPYVSMPVRWDELELRFTPEEALARVRKVGDLFAPALRGAGSLPAVRPPARRPAARRASGPPHARTQSGRRTFVIANGELRLEMGVVIAVDARDERGVYEIIEGSGERGRFDLWFSGRAFSGRWTMTKISEENWRLVKTR